MELEYSPLEVLEARARLALQTDPARVAVALLAAVAAAETDTRDSYCFHYTYAYFWCKGWNV